MLESRWGRRGGSVFGTVGVLLAVGGTALGAIDVPDRPPPECAALPPQASGAAWAALETRLEDGILVGNVARLGARGGEAWSIELPSEAFISEPRDGRLVVGADDGRRSELRLLDTTAGCATPIATERDVVRGAVLAPDGAGLYEHRVRRNDRADLGIWYRDLVAGRVHRVLTAPDPDARFGRTWSTDLLWSTDDSTLVVSTCGAVACRVRTLEPATGRIRSIADPEVGAVVGLVGDRLVTRGACSGMPCPVLVLDAGGGGSDVLLDAAGPARLVSGPDGRPALAHLDGSGSPVVRFVALHPGSQFPPVETSGLLAPLVRGAGVSAELPPGWLVVGPAWHEAPGAPLALRMTDGSTSRIDEVQP